MYISLATRCGFADDIVYNSVGAGFCLRPNTRTPQRQIKIILMNLLPVAHTVAKPNCNEKIILILILIKDNPHGSRKMRVVPEIFWEEETPRRRR